MQRIRAGVFFTIIISISMGMPVAYAQQDSSAVKDSVPQKDIVEVLFKKHMERRAKKKGHDNNKLFISVLPAVGSTPATGPAAVIVSNFAFYLDDKKTTDLSSISAQLSYSVKGQLVCPIRSNIWLKDNKWNLVGDLRFMIYPQATYGLGPTSSWDDKVVMDYRYFRFYQYGLRNIVSRLYAGGGINYDKYFNIRQEGWEQSYPNPVQEYGYGAGDKASAFGYGLDVLWDDRKNVINPRQGSYANILYRFHPAWMGNDEPWESLVIDLRKYFYIPAKQHNNILAFWMYYWTIPRGNPPYLLLPSNGWDTYAATVRGIVQGRYRGKQMLDFEAEYRYRITRNGMFGGVVFASVSSFGETNFQSMSYWRPSFGAGFRIKLNKHSQTNLTIDFAYSLDKNNGIYFDVGEAF